MAEYANIPCRTVRYHTSNFEGLEFEGINKFEVIDAFDRHGSESKTMVGTLRRYGLFPQAKRIVELVLRKENRTIYIDHDQKIYETRVDWARGAPYWEADDSQCTEAASHYAYLSARLPDSVIAGVHVVGYHGRDYLGADYEVYFAPSIGCQEMRFDMVTLDLFGWKTSEYEMLVDSYELGPPASSLFSVPAGYKQVASILSPRRHPWYHFVARCFSS